MGEGLYNNNTTKNSTTGSAASATAAAMDEMNGNESPNKRARTGSLSDHGTTIPGTQILINLIEMDTSNGLVNSDAVVDPIQNHITADQPVDAPITESSSESADDSLPMPSTPPSKQDQLNLLERSILAPIEISSTVYLFPKKWYDAFQSWATGTAQDPGRVDPAGVLLDLDGVLREDATEGQDWIATNDEGWSMIKRWSPLPKENRVDGCSHGADSEVSRLVIPTSPTSNSPTIELRPPELLLIKIIPPKPLSSRSFEFSPIPVSQATSIVVSKSDTLFLLDSKIRIHLGLSPAGSIRCYKFPCGRGDHILSEWTTRKALEEIPDCDDVLEFDSGSKTVGEIGIVAPYVGIAVEWKGLGNSWPMEVQITPDKSYQQLSEVLVSGRTLGGIPNSSFTALNTTRGRSLDKSLVEPDTSSSSPLPRGIARG